MPVCPYISKAKSKGIKSVLRDACIIAMKNVIAFQALISCKIVGILRTIIRPKPCIFVGCNILNHLI